MQHNQLVSLKKRQVISRMARPSTVITVRQFDDGNPIILPESLDEWEEYDLISRSFDPESPYGLEKSQDFTEYDVSYKEIEQDISSYTTVSDNFVEYDLEFKELNNDFEDTAIKDLDFENEGYVEPFDECTIPKPHEIELQDFRVTDETHPNSDLTQIHSPSRKPLQDEKKTLMEDEFMSDLKSIMDGRKVYDPRSKTMIHRDEPTKESSSNELVPYHSDTDKKDKSPLILKNEHEIFDKIAQSMKYANAYDLGSVTIEKRFNDFDLLSEIQKKEEKKEVKKNNPQNLQNINIYKQQGTGTVPVSGRDFIEDLDAIVQQGNILSGSVSIETQPGEEGRIISTPELQPGDFIISSTNDVVSHEAKFLTEPEISYVSVYAGDEKVIEDISGNTLERPLPVSMEPDQVVVVYRHVNMTPEIAQKIIGHLKTIRDNTTPSDKWGLIRLIPYQIVKTYCSTLPLERQEQCRKNARFFKTGADLNNEFYCSESIIQAITTAGLSVCDEEPVWKSTQDVVKLHHNGNLLYIGHLKGVKT